MCFIADDVVRYNFSDVAVHDSRILRKMLAGEVRLWIINELGSQLLPLYCRLKEFYSQEVLEYQLSAAEVAIARMLRIDELAKAENRTVRVDSQFYLVTKGCNEWDGTIVPVKFADVVNLVLVGHSGQLAI